MEVLYPTCAGLDVHQRTVVACVLAGEGRRPTRTVTTFSTMTDDLLKLSDWLTGQGVTHVAMESTGVYWKPIWNVLESSFTLLLVNAQHIKAVPGRKTDVRDGEWIAELLRHGLVRSSFVPAKPQRELRELTRLRTSRVQMRVAESNRLLKTLESANIKLSAVVSDMAGVSARQMLREIVAGEGDPTRLANLAQGKLRHKMAELEQALTGRLTTHLRFLLAEHLATIDELDAGVEKISAEITTRLEPQTSAQTLLRTHPGIGPRIAQILLAELGTDLSRFPSHRQLASWAGLCPGNYQSAGKHQRGTIRPGNAALRSALCEAAHVASRQAGTALAALYHRVAARRGKGRAIIAVAHAILVNLYHMLKDGTVYQDHATTATTTDSDAQRRTRLERQLVARLQRLGNTVTLQPMT
jgi:transposase